MTRWLIAAITDWLIIALAFFAIWLYPVIAFVPAAVLIGSRQHALVVLGHDGGHYLASSDRGLNDLLAALLCFYPMLIPLDGYRAFHFTHHRALGGAGDPEIEHKQRFRPAYDPPFGFWKMLALGIGDLCGLGALEIPSLVKIVWRGATIYEGVYLALWWVGMLVLLVEFHAFWIAAVWMACYGTTAWAIFRIRTVTEHPFLTSTPRLKAPLQPFRWLIWPHNVWMHWEHHKRPGVPFYRLSEVREMFGYPEISGRLFA